MTLIYAFVARGATVLAEYTTYSGNFSTIAIQCLQKCPETDSKFTYTCDGHTFNYLVDSGYTFLVVADGDVGRQLPFSFLARVAEDFNRKYGPRALDAMANSLDREYGPALKEHMAFCTEHPEEMNKVAMVQKQVQEVKNIMMDNIEKVLDRGEKIELLVDKTEELRFKADNFHKTGKQLRRKMWWNNLKMKMAFIFVVLAVIFIIFCSVCFSGGNCLASKGGDDNNDDVPAPPEPEVEPAIPEPTDISPTSP
mmetsp:Transcript_35574/g.42843  ORF Transcript_35574/g.42843 Transcript_35574/m.42843 type:complete len:253 (-) Transcript_35574:708-1466(-)|eukprot:CAMPEP_0197850120 /NCGR_PEP_ID=MMETSP1438-20131217/14279_1 /TAXON_ID=1461541 /ORGANISM="Pterosperma sp., Strain CCMP1384" /LENGTH=252 /DNA_ID=CAMNT_0043463101 /DNA_START=274 /DNA_END=1032 /DNA_ORIENTATION=+